MFAAIGIVIVACSSTESEESALGADEIDALARSFAGIAADASRSGSTPQAVRSGLAPLSWCSPTKLTPPVACPGGGSVYTTVNLQCSGPSGCCAANPACSRDQMTFGGQGALTYQSCALTAGSGRHVVVNGALFDGVSANFSVTCNGAVSGTLVYTISGNQSVTVSGREVCRAPTMVKVTATVTQTIVVTVSGSICGTQLQRTYSQGCVVRCASGACCSGGTVCSACTDSCVPAGAVDCCNGRYCPAGTRCISGDRCAI